MRKVLLVLTATAAATALGFAVAGLASSGSSSGLRQATSEETSEETSESTSESVKPTSLKSTLGTAAEVPKPTGVKAGAGGTFSLMVTEKGDAYSAKYTLTFRNLTGKAVAAHIHRGKPGKAGPVIVGLCRPCTSGKGGTKPVSNAAYTALKAGNTYVNIRTAKNAGGEIRGQIKKVG